MVGRRVEHIYRRYGRGLSRRALMVNLHKEERRTESRTAASAPSRDTRQPLTEHDPCQETTIAVLLLAGQTYAHVFRDIRQSCLFSTSVGATASLLASAFSLRELDAFAGLQLDPVTDYNDGPASP